MLMRVMAQTAGNKTFVLSSRPPQAHLDDGELHPGIGKILKGQRGDAVENAQVFHCVHGRPHPADQTSQIIPAASTRH